MVVTLQFLLGQTGFFWLDWFGTQTTNMLENPTQFSDHVGHLEQVQNLLGLQVLLLDVFVARMGILAGKSTADGASPTPAVPAPAVAAADAPPLGVKVEKVVGVLLLAARLEDGPNFKLICLGYVVVALLRRLVVVTLLAPAAAPLVGREPLLVVVLVSSAVVVPG